MTLDAVLAQARAGGDWSALVAWMPFASFLKLRVDADAERFSCTLPFEDTWIGNPRLPALHGGAIGGFLECAGMLYLLWHMESTALPKIVNFSFDYLRSGKPEDVHAHVHMVKQGQRVAHLRIEAWQSSPDKPIAIGTGNFLLKPNPAPKESPA
jgi:acyl-coenzyme A thioesterase PaaI-like protein